MRIVRLQAENIKRLIAVDISPSGSVVKITGKNGAGKSSVLDALWWALGGTKNVQSEPIRKGEKKAKTVLSLGEAGGVTMTVTRSYTQSGSTLTIENADGAVFRSPQSILDSLLGQLTFDPLEFMRMKPAEQFATLRTLTGVDLTDLDANYADYYQKRTDVNREAKSLAARAEAIIVPIDAPEHETPVQEVAEKLAAAVQTQREREEAQLLISTATIETTELRQRRTDMAEAATRALNNLKAEYERRQKEIQEKAQADDTRIASDIETKGRSIENAKLTLSHPAPEVDDLRAQLSGQEELNRAARLRAERAALLKQQADAEERSGKLTAEIEKVLADKDARLAAATFPLPGLSFGDGVVTFNGLPLEQASSAEQLRISMAMAMNLNPKLRVLRITDGSLLDSASMKIVEEMCEAGDYQAWIESVEESGKVGIVIEDGQVAAVNA